MDSIGLLKQKMELFGYQGFRGGQEQVIRHALAGKNSLVLMPTGMGKSFCYQAFALLSEDLVVVVSPLIALMKDQSSRAQKMGIKSTDIHSLLSPRDRTSRYEKLKEKKYNLIFVSPERFRVSEFMQSLSQNKISLFVVDEAHCISEWGHDFRPEYTRMGEVWKVLGSPPLMALTATATPEVQSDIKKQLKLDTVKTFSEGFLRTNLGLHIEESYSLEGKLEKFKSIQRSGPTIIYFSLISTLEKFSDSLEKLGTEHVVYHGQMKRSYRNMSQKKFLSGEVDLILATPAFGLGIDKSDIRHVIHAEVPNSIESYYQEVGRAGRDGKPATNYLLYDEDDVSIQMEFIKWSNPDSEFIKLVYSFIRDPSVNLLGYDGLREKLLFKSRKDFRLETALNLFDRWGVTTGSLEKKNLLVVNDIPSILVDSSEILRQQKNDQMKLLRLVQYITSKECRLKIIMDYFSVHLENGCGLCDNCKVI